MDPTMRRAVSELAHAYADAVRDLATFELEDTVTQASHVARRLELLTVRAAELKIAMRESMLARTREPAA